MTPRENADNDLGFTFLMPCLNEERTLAACIDEALYWADFVSRQTGDTYEILIADNGSTDQSVQIAKARGARVVVCGETGYGNALRCGIKAARGKFVIMADSDLSYDFGALPEMMNLLRGGADLVMGNRFSGKIDDGAMPKTHRYLGNPVLSFLGRLFFGLKVGDFNCGIRGFSRKKAEHLKLSSEGMDFASEMVVKFGLSKAVIKEVPVRLRRDGRDRRPHLNTWKDGWKTLKFLLTYCPSWLFSVPGWLLMAAGFVGGAFLLNGPVKIKLGGTAVVFDLNTLVYCSAFFMAGFQLVATGSFLKGLGYAGGGEASRRSWPSVEAGVAAGAILFLIGIGGSLLAIQEWGETGFSDLDPFTSLRIAVPSSAAVAIGIQVSIMSFLSGVVKIVRNGGSKSPTPE